MAVVAPARLRGVEDSVRALAVEFRLQSHDLAAELAVNLHRVIPELGGEDAQALEETRASCEANLATVFALLAEGADAAGVVAPAGALDYVRSLVRRNVSLAVLLRAYRLGHAFVFDRVSDALGAQIEHADQLAAAVELCSSFMFTYVDRVCDQLVEEYDAERSRWVRSAAAVRSELVRALLAGDPVDRDRASASLSYELRRHHVALIIWTSRAEEAAGLDMLAVLERTAASAALALGCREPLVVSGGTSTLWAWAGTHECLSDTCTDRLVRLRTPAGVRIAAGLPGAGVAGFRSSHLEAAQAQKLARLAGPRADFVTEYRTAELPSLLASDLDRARAFVARELGGLASSEETASRLRETLQLYLRTGGSHVRTSRLLHVHQNTVAYRIRRAEELLGRPAGERRLELEAALLLAAQLGPAVLPEESA